MRLIDADELSHKFFEIGCHITKIHPMDIMNIISEQPTAYDVDKVVAEITDRMDHERDSQIRARKAGNIDASNIHKYGICCLALAIDIVKRGGISEYDA